MLELNELPDSIKAEVERALAGDEVAVTRGGRPAGRLTGTATPPPSPTGKQPLYLGLRPGSIIMHASFWDEMDIEEMMDPGGPV